MRIRFRVRMYCIIIFFFCVLIRVILKLFKPMALEKGQRFTFRNPGFTFATGVVTEVLPNLPEEERIALADGRKAMLKYEDKLEKLAAKQEASA